MKTKTKMKSKTKTKTVEKEWAEKDMDLIAVYQLFQKLKKKTAGKLSAKNTKK